MISWWSILLVIGIVWFIICLVRAERNPKQEVQPRRFVRMDEQYVNNLTEDDLEELAGMFGPQGDNPEDYQ